MQASASAALEQAHAIKTTWIVAYPSICLMHAFVSTSNPMVVETNYAGLLKSKAHDVASKLPAICYPATQTHTPLQDINACTHSPRYAIQKQLVCLPQHQHHHHRCAVAHRFGRQQHNAIAPFNNTRGIYHPIWDRTPEETATFSPWKIYAQCAPVLNASSRYPKTYLT